MRSSISYLFFALWLLPAALPAQVQALRPDCDSLYRAGEKLMAKPNPPLEEALRCYLNALNCNSALSGKIGPKIQDIFERINALKNSEEKQRELAVRNEREAQKNLAKANRLIRHFNFQGEKAAWAYKNGRFAVINTEGDTLTDFIYENPEPFRKGVALAKADNQFVFVDQKGAEVSQKFDYILPFVGNRYLGGVDQTKYILDNFGKTVFVVQDNIINFGISPYEKITQNGKVGIMRRGGEPFIAPLYDDIDLNFQDIIRYKKDGKWGLLDTNGIVLTAPLYDFIDGTYFQFIRMNQGGQASTMGVIKGGKWGLLDKRGEELIPVKYEGIKWYKDGWIAVNSGGQSTAWQTDGGKWGFCNPQGEEVIAPEYDAIGPFSEGLAAATKEGKAFYIDTSGKKVLQLPHQWTEAFMHGHARALKDEMWTLIDKKGKEVLAHPYPVMEPFEFDYARVMTGGSRDENGKITGGKWGLIDTNGVEVIKPVYDWISDVFYDVVKLNRGGTPVYKGSYELKDGKWGAANVNGEEIVPVQYDYVELTRNGVIVATEVVPAYWGGMEGGKWGMLDKSGRWIAPLEFEAINANAGDFILFKKEGRWGAMDAHGLKLIPADYDELIPMSRELIFARKGGFCGILSPDNKAVVPLQYDAIMGSMGNFLKVKKDKSWSFVMPGFSDPIFRPYAFTEPYYDDQALVNLGGDPNSLDFFSQNVSGGKWGIIDRDGREKLPPQYDFAQFFGKGLTKVNTGGSKAFSNIVRGGKWGLVNRAGIAVIPVEYDDIRFDPNGRIIVNKGGFINHLQTVEGGKWGLRDTLGNEILPLQYEDIRPDVFGKYWFKEADKWGLIDAKGKVLLKPTYAHVEGYTVLDALTPVNLGGKVDENGWVTGGKWGFVDTLGKEVVSPQYTMHNSDFSPTLKGRLYVCVDGIPNAEGGIDGGRWGCIDRKGRTIIPPEFDAVFFPYGARAFVRQSGKWALYDTLTRQLEWLPFDILQETPGGEILANIGGKWVPDSGFTGGKWGMIDSSGAVVIPLKYRSIDGFIRGLSVMTKAVDSKGDSIGSAYKCGYIDKTGREVVPPVYDAVRPFLHKLLIVGVKETGTANPAGRFNDGYKWGLLDANGTIIQQPRFSDINDITQNLWIVEEDGRQGLMDSNGLIVVPLKYTKISLEINGLWKTLIGAPDDAQFDSSQKRKWGLLDQSGKELIPPLYDEMLNFSEGMALVRQSGKAGIIDSLGYLVLPCDYSDIYVSGYRIYLTEQNGHYGLFAPDHHILIPANYEKIGYIDEENHWIRVQQNGKWGWVDYAGRTLIPCRYDAASPFQKGRAEVLQLPYPDFFYINTKGEMLPGN